MKATKLPAIRHTKFPPLKVANERARWYWLDALWYVGTAEQWLKMALVHAAGWYFDVYDFVRKKFR